MERPTQPLEIDRDQLPHLDASFALLGAMPELVQRQMDAIDIGQIDPDNLSHDNKKLLGLANYVNEHTKDTDLSPATESMKELAESAKTELATHLAIEELQGFVDENFERAPEQAGSSHFIKGPEQLAVQEHNTERLEAYLTDKGIDMNQAIRTGRRMQVKHFHEEMRLRQPENPGEEIIFKLDDFEVDKEILAEELELITASPEEEHQLNMARQALHFDKDVDKPMSVADQVAQIYGKDSEEYEYATAPSTSVARIDTDLDSEITNQLKMLNQGLELVKNDPQLLDELKSSPHMQRPEMKRALAGLPLEDAIENIQDLTEHLIEEERVMNHVNAELVKDGKRPLLPEANALNPDIRGTSEDQLKMSQLRREVFAGPDRSQENEEEQLLNAFRQVEEEKEGGSLAVQVHNTVIGRIRDATIGRFTNREDKETAVVDGGNLREKLREPNTKDQERQRAVEEAPTPQEFQKAKEKAPTPEVKVHPSGGVSANRFEQKQAVQLEEQTRQQHMPEINIKDVEKNILQEAVNEMMRPGKQGPNQERGAEGPGM